MNVRFSSPSSGIARVLTVAAACLLTVTLFGGVTLGLTGEDGLAFLAQAGSLAAGLQIA